jgi:hypothetical protein
VDEGELLHRAHAPVAHRGVRGVAPDLEPERQRPGVRRHHRPGGRLRDDAEIAEVPAPDRGPGAQAAVLLADDAVQRHRPHQADPRPPDGGQRGEGGDDAGLHVARPPAVDVAADEAGDERVAVPERAVTGRYDVGVPGQDQGGTARLGRGQRADDAPRLGALHLLAGGVRGRGGLGEVDRPDVDVAAELLEPAGQLVLHLALGGRPADRGDGEHRGQPVDHPPLVHGVDDAGLHIGQVGPTPGHGRSLARVGNAVPGPAR